MSADIPEQTIQERDYIISPLSGRGQMISVHRDPPYRLVVWGDLMFELPDEMIRTILDGFLTDTGRWYLLGASMTGPDPSGFGSFVRKAFPKFSSRHASAIAAILVHEGFISFRGKKLIELKKIAGHKEMERLAKEKENA